MKQLIFISVFLISNLSAMEDLTLVSICESPLNKQNVIQNPHDSVKEVDINSSFSSLKERIQQEYHVKRDQHLSVLSQLLAEQLFYADKHRMLLRTEETGELDAKYKAILFYFDYVNDSIWLPFLIEEEGKLLQDLSKIYKRYNINCIYISDLPKSMQDEYKMERIECYYKKNEFITCSSLHLKILMHDVISSLISSNETSLWSKLRQTIGSANNDTDPIMSSISSALIMKGPVFNLEYWIKK